MTHTLAILLLAIVDLAGLLMVPLGLPGLWVMILGLLGYGWFTDFQTVGLWTTTLVLALALLGELIETWLGFRFARRYGALKRAAWGALIGGLVGAVVGVPVPVIFSCTSFSFLIALSTARSSGRRLGRRRVGGFPTGRMRHFHFPHHPGRDRGASTAASARSFIARSAARYW